jgi:hypothetical protein
MAMHGRLRAHLLLADLQGTLVLADLEELHHTPLIWCKASNLTNNLTHELDVLAQALQPAQHVTC